MTGAPNESKKGSEPVEDSEGMGYASGDSRRIEYQRAVDTMPWWGRALSWLVWKSSVFAWLGVALALGAVGWSWGVAVLGVGVVCLGVRRTPSPYRYAVLVTRRDVPAALRSAAAYGKNPPEEERTES